MAVSQPTFEGLVCPFIDARRGEVYYSVYKITAGALERLGAYSVSPPATMVSELLKRLDSERDGARVLLAGPGPLLRGTDAEKETGRFTTTEPGRSVHGPGPVAILGAF